MSRRPLRRASVIALGVCATLVATGPASQAQPVDGPPPQIVPKPDPKPVPERYLKAAGQQFDLALAAEAAGRRRAAIDHYEAALTLAPHANPAFNLAELLRLEYLDGQRIREWDKVELAYRLYLALAPASSERSAVAAQLASWLRTATPWTLVTPHGYDLDAAYVLVDGVVAVRPGAKVVPHRLGSAITVPLTPGQHVINVVSSLGALQAYAHPRPLVDGESTISDLPPPAAGAGNVLFAGAVPAFLRGAAFTGPTPARLTLAPGRHGFQVFQITSEPECPPLRFEVARTGITHVFFVRPQRQPCPTAVRASWLDLEP